MNIKYKEYAVAGFSFFYYFGSVFLHYDVNRIVKEGALIDVAARRIVHVL